MLKPVCIGCRKKLEEIAPGCVANAWLREINGTQAGFVCDECHFKKEEE